MEPVNKAFDEAKFDSVSEGSAQVLFPKGKVFYNPVQQFNRDLSVTGIRAWSIIYEKERQEKVANKAKNKEENGHVTKKRNVEQEPNAHFKGINIIEALSATGLRAIRYGKEIPGVKTVIANDISKSAVEAIEQNVVHNSAQDTVQPNQDDANMLMYKHKGDKKDQVHIVDLDPYGSASPFMDAAVQSVCDGGLLLVTCTDLGVLAGNSYPEKCFSHYGGSTLYSEASHESALRLVLSMVASSAAKYGRAIEPQLSLSIDFYLRCFIRVYNSPARVKLNMSRSMVVYKCSGCGTVTPQALGKATPLVSKKAKTTDDQQKSATNNNNYKFSYSQGPPVGEKCQHCGFTHHIAGPMWAGRIHNKDFIDQMLAVRDTLDPNVYGTLDRIKGMLSMARQELPDSPFYVLPPDMASIARATCPPLIKFVSAILNAGYKVSGTHAKPGCVKTDAPYSLLWNIIRKWIEQEHEGGSTKVKPGSPGEKLVVPRESDIDVSFDTHPEAVELDKMRKSKLLRYQVNPTANWGPKSRAG